MVTSLHSILFSAFLFVYSCSPFIIMLSITWYLLLPRTFFPFTIPSRIWVRKSRYWGEMLLSPIHCCDVTKPPFLLSGKLCTSFLHSNRLFVYTVCCRCRGQCFSVLRTRHTDVEGDSSGRSYVTQQWHNVPLLRTRDLDIETKAFSLFYFMKLIGNT